MITMQFVRHIKHTILSKLSAHLFVVSVVGKPFHYEIVDSIQSCLLIRSVLYGHGYEGNVGVGRLHHVLGGVVLGDSMVGAVGGAHVPATQTVLT